MLKVGVIGVGNLGQHHARVYSQLPGVRLMGVADSDPARAKEVARKVGCDFFENAEALLPLVKAVSVVVPTAGHFSLAERCIKSGVAVLLEKPMTETLQQADALIAMARERSVVLQVGHIERFNPAIRAIGELKSKPLFIEAHRLGPYSPRGVDTGVVLELMIHDLDIVLDLVGEPVESVEAIGVPVLSRTEDIANVRLRFKGGCVANLTASRVTTEKQRKIRIFTRDAYLSVDYLAKQVKVYRLKEGADPSQAGSLIGLSRMVVIDRLAIEDQEQLKLELASFVEAVQEGKQPVVSGEAGRDALALGLEIERQIRQGIQEKLGKGLSA
jgi:predicted dehydrogenase